MSDQFLTARHTAEEEEEEEDNQKRENTRKREGGQGLGFLLLSVSQVTTLTTILHSNPKPTNQRPGSVTKAPKSGCVHHVFPAQQEVLHQTDAEASHGHPSRGETVQLSSLSLQQPAEGLTAAAPEDAHR